MTLSNGAPGTAVRSGESGENGAAAPGGLRAAFDVFHVHAPNPTMTLALASLPPRAPFVITHHSDVVRQRLLSLAFRPVEWLVYGRAAAVGSTSPLYPAGSPLLRSFAG